MLSLPAQWYHRSEHGVWDPGGVGGSPAMLHLTLLLLCPHWVRAVAMLHLTLLLPCPHGVRAVASAVRRGEPGGVGAE